MHPCLDNVRTVVYFALPGIGDSLLAMPALSALRKSLPHAQITGVTMFPGAQIVLEQSGNVDEVVCFNFPKEGLLKSLRFVMGLRSRRFDMSVLAYPSNRLEYNAISFLVGAGIRLGHRYNHWDILCGNWLNTLSVREDDRQSNIEENLRLVRLVTSGSAEVDAVQFDVTAGREAASRWLAARGMKNQLLIGFHPGGSTRKNHINKRWPAERFVQLGQALCKRGDVGLLVFGGPEEEALRGEIASAIGPAAVSVNTPDVMDTCAILAACNHFVSNDSALLHLAGAIGVPTTALFGPTNAAWVRIPGALRHEVLMNLDCQPCFYYSPKHLSCAKGDFRCLRGLPVSDVAAHVLSAINSLHAGVVSTRE